MTERPEPALLPYATLESSQREPLDILINIFKTNAELIVRHVYDQLLLKLGRSAISTSEGRETRQLLIDLRWLPRFFGDEAVPEENQAAISASFSDFKRLIFSEIVKFRGSFHGNLNLYGPKTSAEVLADSELAVEGLADDDWGRLVQEVHLLYFGVPLLPS